MSQELKLKDIKLEEKRAYYRNYYHQHKKLKGRENKTVVCAICGKNFETNTNKKYCSDECKKQARKNVLKKYDNNHQEQRKKYSQDITKRLKFNISRAFNRYFLKTKTTKEYLQYFNYTVEDLKLHIEKQFKKDMSWDNYGKVWHIDHIRPQSWFDFNNTEEIKKCWSLDNLQPLYAKENFSKGNRYEG